MQLLAIDGGANPTPSAAVTDSAYDVLLSRIDAFPEALHSHILPSTCKSLSSNTLRLSLQARKGTPWTMLRVSESLQTRRRSIVSDGRPGRPSSKQRTRQK